MSSIVLLYVKPVSPRLMIEFRSCFVSDPSHRVFRGEKVDTRVESSFSFSLICLYVVEWYILSRAECQHLITLVAAICTLQSIKKDKKNKKSEMWKHFDVDRANDGRKYSKMQWSVIVVPIIRSPIINDRQGKMSITDGSDRQLNMSGEDVGIIALTSNLIGPPSGRECHFSQ